MEEREFSELIKETLDALNELKQQLIGQKGIVTPNWVNREQVMSFLGYGNTQMAALEKRNDLVVAKVGKRKFYLRDSVESMLQNSVTRNNCRK